jgi:hypothetical protein
VIANAKEYFRLFPNRAFPDPPGGLAAMGKTVPTYRMALEWEIDTWKGFKKALNCEEDREAFETMMDMCRNNAAASSNASNPVIFEPMVMSILLAQQKNLRDLEYRLNEVLRQEICIKIQPEPKSKQ